MTSGASRKARMAASFVLALAFAAACAAPARAQVEQESGREKCLSAGDGCEAARLAVRFVRRLEETGDAAPLVAEFFLPDFAERFQKFLREGGLMEEGDPVFFAVSRDTLTAAEPADVRRTFVALLNFWHHFCRFGDAVDDATEARHDLVSVLAEDKDGRLRRAVQKAALPPAFFDTLKSDPLLAMLQDLYDGGGASSVEDGEGEGGDGGEALMLSKFVAASVRTVARLRTLTEKVERVASLMRAATDKLRDELRAYPDRSPARETDLGDVYRVETATYGREFMGFPAGTPFISARLFPYVVVAVRVEGGLKVVGVLPDFDGD